MAKVEKIPQVTHGGAMKESVGSVPHAACVERQLRLSSAVNSGNSGGKACLAMYYETFEDLILDSLGAS
jgi:hypothetical protein